MKFTIINVEYVKCLNLIDKNTDINIYKFIEKLIYNELPEQEQKLYANILKNHGYEHLIHVLKKQFSEFNINTVGNTSVKTKQRKNINDVMIENYVVKNNKSLEFLKDISLKIFLKIIPRKNIIIEDGDIVEIKIE